MRSHASSSSSQYKAWYWHAGVDGLIVWDASKGSTLHSILAEESLRWMQVAADGSSVLTASGNRCFVASDLRTEAQLYSFPGGCSCL